MPLNCLRTLRGLGLPPVPLALSATGQLSFCIFGPKGEQEVASEDSRLRNSVLVRRPYLRMAVD